MLKSLSGNLAAPPWTRKLQELRAALPQGRPEKSLEKTGAEQSSAREAPSWGLKEVAGAEHIGELQFLETAEFPGP